jgi:tungstate transport system substrate-binding protein
VIAAEGDPRLIARYDVIEINPQKHAGAQLGPAKVFANWLMAGGTAGY